MYELYIASRLDQAVPHAYGLYYIPQLWEICTVDSRSPNLPIINYADMYVIILILLTSFKILPGGVQTSSSE